MKITKYLIGGLATLALVGCKDKMRELNSDPAIVGDANPAYMFFDAVQNLDYSSRSASSSIFSSEGRLMQYFVKYDGAVNDTYCKEGSYSAPGQIGEYYTWLYSVGYKLVSLQRHIDAMTPEAALPYQDLRAKAGIMKVYHAFRVFQNYGAAVYSQAFNAITEGVTLPAYDLFTKEVYESLDDELAGYIAVLAQANENQAALGAYDPIYGYEPINKMGKPNARNKPNDERVLWQKFGNSYRLYMAWIMKAADPARFDKVLAETKGKWFETAADGAYSYQNGSNYNGTPYNSNGNNEISVLYAVSDNFVSYLKELGDPRLPLLARANSLYADNKSLQWIQAYFPDSLQQHMVYDKDSKTWNLKNWNGVFDFEADPMLAYQGISPNPFDYDQENPGEFWGQRNFTFRFYHPNYKPGDTEGNKKLGPWTVTNQGVVSEDFPATFTVQNADTSFTLELGSRPQGRYLVAGGGKSFSNDNNGGNGYDGAVNDNGEIYFRRPLYTYPEFCFMMAYLSNEGVDTGAPADEWFKNGVTEAMKELQTDAIRYGVQVATNSAATYYYETTKSTYVVNPKVVGVNDTKLYDITDQITSYVNGLVLSPEAIVGQMWIYAYNQPIKMWDWWRLTDYPKIVDVKTPADRPTGLYWVKPQTRTEGENMDWPRRGNLPGTKAANNANFNAIRNVLLEQPGYGTTYNQTTGCIFWDQLGLQQQGL